MNSADNEEKAEQPDAAVPGSGSIAREYARHVVFAGIASVGVAGTLIAAKLLALVLTNSAGAYGVTIAEHIVMVTLELMRRLKAVGKKVGILSNMSPDFHERLFVPRAAAYRALADAEVISGLVKLYKPEKPIYDLTARRMGLPPERLLFVDDTPSNVEAARRYGWQSETYPE